ncbi:hypothetical protein NQ317_003261 [Molorchus minor]|uniref:Uncharacterized protein n=1 Tax=Molorchus minor TaxID=1323400 RepID=A0ABQ9JM55_9CUCU|nr:hypothetical protein NQ317_003261 [Molorchus minor]
MCGKQICNSAASLNVAISNIFVEFLWLLQIRLPHYSSVRNNGWIMSSIRGNFKEVKEDLKGLGYPIIRKEKPKQESYTESLFKDVVRPKEKTG